MVGAGAIIVAARRTAKIYCDARNLLLLKLVLQANDILGVTAAGQTMQDHHQRGRRGYFRLRPVQPAMIAVRQHDFFQPARHRRQAPPLRSPQGLQMGIGEHDSPEYSAYDYATWYSCARISPLSFSLMHCQLAGTTGAA